MARETRSAESGWIARIKLLGVGVLVKLNVWQRAGIVASILWALGAGGYLRYQDGDRAYRFMASMYAACVGDDLSSAEARCSGDMQKNFALALEGSWENAAFFAFVPPVLAWLLAYICIWIGRWVWAGRKVS